MVDAAEDPDVVRHFAVRMGIETRRLADLVQEIIVLSRLQAPDVAIADEVVSLDRVIAGVIAGAIDRVAVDAREHGTPISVEGREGRQVLGDHDLLTMALRNLLDDAMRYSPPGEPIGVVTKVTPGDEGMISIAVSERGHGIDDSELSRVFERFFGAEPARGRVTGGSVLGLSVVKHVTANHGAEVSV